MLLFDWISGHVSITCTEINLLDYCRHEFAEEKKSVNAFWG